MCATEDSSVIVLLLGPAIVSGLAFQRSVDTAPRLEPPPSNAPGPYRCLVVGALALCACAQCKKIYASSTPSLGLLSPGYIISLSKTSKHWTQREL